MNELYAASEGRALGVLRSDVPRGWAVSVTLIGPRRQVRLRIWKAGVASYVVAAPTLARAVREMEVEVGGFGAMSAG